MRLTVLAENVKSPSKPDLISKHGLSFFVELTTAGKTTRLLLDTGPTADIALKNAKKLGLDLRRLDYIMISHGHYDHTGGLLAILEEIGKDPPVIIHPEALQQKFVVKKGHLKKIGLPCQISDLKKSCRLILRRGPTSVIPGVWVSGEIKRTTKFEKVKKFKTKKGDKLVRDLLPDDQALFVDVKGKGLVVLCGCAHAGLINTIKQAKKLSVSKSLYAIAGGFHLISASAEAIKETIKHLRDIGVTYLMPCHCTGKNAEKEFAKAFGRNCQKIKTGDSVNF